MSPPIDLGPGRKADYAARMFPAIARSYDFLTRLLTFSLDKRWRRFTVTQCGLRPGATALDLATGTGELALELARAVAPNGKVVGLDLCPEMLARAREKFAEGPWASIVELRQGDAGLELPFSNESFDCATMGLALRYFDVPRTVGEMARVVRRGGRVVILEFATPRLRWARLGHTPYAFTLMPALGGLLAGDRKVWELLRFLPRSVAAFYPRDELVGIMRGAGLAPVTVHDLTFGVVAVYVGHKPLVR
jgi:demethylmenaquinone methyltransferase/2-methoxy-6-polyprenyl-1,4-benzoquinol methylase